MVGTEGKTGKHYQYQIDSFYDGKFKRCSRFRENFKIDNSKVYTHVLVLSFFALKSY